MDENKKNEDVKIMDESALNKSADSKKKIKVKDILILQLIVLVYTLSGVAGKFASGNEFLSWRFILFYGLEIVNLGVYALLWQQAIKKFDLSVAYANRAVAILWSMLWAVLFFSEKIKVTNIIGVIIIIAGTIIVNGDKHE